MDPSKIELFGNMFIARMNMIEEENLMETEIIKEIKYYLLDTGTPYEEINNILFEFYQYYDINVSMQLIESIIINNMPNANLPPLPNPMMGAFIQLYANNNNIIFHQIFNQGPLQQPQVEEPNEDDEEEDMPDLVPANAPLPQTHQNMINMINILINGLPNNNHNYEDVKVTVDENDLDALPVKTLENNLDSDCTICMGKMEKDEVVTELGCTHTFHNDCIKPYLKEYNYKCPVCRKEVGKTKYNI
jgi:hypothetical protein